jgi:hypothetical protein
MNTRGRLSAPAVLMLLVACSAASAPPGSRPSPTSTGTPSAPASTHSAAAHLSGRIAFDNHDDVWTINATART